MRKFVSMILSISIIFSMSACGKSQEDFKDAKWGMTLDEVIKMEEDNGNKVDESDKYSKFYLNDNKHAYLTFEDLTINGYNANVVYVFYKSANIDGGVPHIAEEELKANPEKYPDELKFNDHVLLTGTYRFENLNKEDIIEILDNMKSKYGEPIEKKEVNDSTGYRWSNKRTEITFNHTENQLSINYYAKYEVVKDLQSTNSSNKNDDDL